jgi:hypothetical protein
MRDNMTILDGWKDLEQYGISFLTGEADAYSLRALCSLNEDGVKLMESFLSVKVNKDPWSNYKINGKETVASIMIPYSIYRDLATFCLFHVDNFQEVVINDMWIGGCTKEHLDHYAEKYKEYYPNTKFKHNFGYKADPSISRNGRNVHQMSGRVE